VAAGLVVAACTAGNVTATTTPDRSSRVVASVIRIADGDTMDVRTPDGELTVRLVAVNAPDRGECFHDESLLHLAEILQGTTVTLQVLAVDRFGRTLAHVFLDERHLNIELIELGLAIATDPGADDPHRDPMIQAEEEAFTSGTGLWADTACGSHPPLPAVVIDPTRSVVDPLGPDDEQLGSERVVIVNQDNEPVDLSGWGVRDASSRHRFGFAPGTLLASGESLTIASDHPRWSPGMEAVWNNDGDMALLHDPGGTVVSRWRY
jgi:endonuclease YncB( thermonuclease family)